MDAQTVKPNPLTDLKQTARAHWQKYRPTMVRQLEEMGQLEDALDAAVELTTQEVHQLRTATGCSVFEAWMEVRQNYVILPAEADEETGEDEPINPVQWIGIIAGMDEDE
jgi:hypothetical protein